MRSGRLTAKVVLLHDGDLKCSACQQSIELASGERVGFREACPSCGRDLHACIQCAHHDRSAYNGCREPQSERVTDPERANRCEWYCPAEEAPGGSGQELDVARAKLEALFKK